MKISRTDAILTVDELFHLLGADAFARLTEAKGGLRILIPKAAHDGHELCRLIGLSGLMSLVDVLGGCRFDVPKGTMAEVHARHAEIRRQRLAGRSESEVAMQFGLTQRQVRRIMAAEPRIATPGAPDERQLNLFAA